MTPRIAAVELSPINLPMRQPFVTAAGSKRESRNLSVLLRLDDGTAGYGEASASLAWPDQTQTVMKKALAPIARRLIGLPISRWQQLSEEVWKSAGRYPPAAAALECALLDAYTRARGISLWRWFGGKRRSVTTSLTISAWPPDTAGRAARAAARSGFRRLKVKLTGKNVDEDFQRLLAVHRAAPRAALWLDGNQGFTAEQAVRFCARARSARLPVRLFEQPVPRQDWEGLARVEKEGRIPVVADESVRGPDEARKLVRRRAAPVINVKLAKCGIFGALEIIRLSKRAGVRLMIGCMAESAPGIRPSVALACGTGAFDYVDLDSHLLVVSPPGPAGFVTRGNRLSLL